MADIADLADVTNSSHSNDTSRIKVYIHARKINFANQVVDTDVRTRIVFLSFAELQVRDSKVTSVNKQI
jgi:hypothetical protein